MYCMHWMTSTNEGPVIAREACAAHATARKELESIADDAERERRVREMTALAQENAKALDAAQLFELDDVIDPGRHAPAHRRSSPPRR